MHILTISLLPLLLLPTLTLTAPLATLKSCYPTLPLWPQTQIPTLALWLPQPVPSTTSLSTYFTTRAHTILSLTHYPTITQLTSTFSLTTDTPILPSVPISPGTITCTTSVTSADWIDAYVLLSLIHDSLLPSSSSVYSCDSRGRYVSASDSGCTVVGRYGSAGVRICPGRGRRGKEKVEGQEVMGRGREWKEGAAYGCGEVVVMLWSVLGGCKVGGRVEGGYEFEREGEEGRVEVFGWSDLEA